MQFLLEIFCWMQKTRQQSRSTLIQRYGWNFIWKFYDTTGKWIKPLQLCVNWEAQHFFSDCGSDWNLEICTVPLKMSWIPKGKCLERFFKVSVKQKPAPYSEQQEVSKGTSHHLRTWIISSWTLPLFRCFCIATDNAFLTSDEIMTGNPQVICGIHLLVTSALHFYAFGLQAKIEIRRNWPEC